MVIFMEYTMVSAGYRLEVVALIVVGLILIVSIIVLTIIKKLKDK